GQRGMHLGLTGRFDVILLDRGLPVVDGMDLLATLRESGVLTPVLILSALGNAADRVAGLDGGAEDYLAKPFDIDELLARLRVLLRRHLDRARILPIGEAELDLDSREVRDRRYADRQPVALSERECQLLAALATRPQQIF